MFTDQELYYVEAVTMANLETGDHGDMYWSADVYASRIEHAEQHKRYEAGSPNADEIKAYAAAVSTCPRKNLAVVLGMTPELRRMAASTFGAILSIDSNAPAVDLYRHWLDASLAVKERIIIANWMETRRYCDTGVDAILGDGVLPNMPDRQAYAALLRGLRSCLVPNGLFVTRTVFIPRDIRMETCNADALTQAYRDKKLDASEYGFGMRFLGYLERHYDPASAILDNKAIFLTIQEAHRRGELQDDEFLATQRYFFPGPNCILHQDEWESLLSECGFTFRPIHLQGKHWYTYYSLYACHAS